MAHRKWPKGMAPSGLTEARMPCPKGQETSQQKQAGLITIYGHLGKEKLGASQMWEHPQQGACALRLAPGMEQKGASESQRCMSQVPTQPKVRKPKTSGNQGLFPKEAPPFPRKSPCCYPGCTILAKIKSRATTYQKPNKYKGLGAEGNPLGPAMTKQL